MAPKRTDQAQADTWAHYVQGWTIPAIASELKLSEASVRSYLKAEQDACRKRRAELAEGYLQRELDGLDALERRLNVDIEAGEPNVRATASKVILDVKARRAKYLGLDKPLETRHTLSLEDLVAASRETSD